MKKSTRKLVVFSTLLSVLTVTSALLMALAPAPIPVAPTSLFAIDAPTSFEPVFNTRAPLAPSRWKYIYIHHSATSAGNAMTLGQMTGGAGDHFVIGNGDGAEDGEIQISQRWNEQQIALPPAGASKIDAACISICVVGDFDRRVPTQTQLRRLTQLVSALQGQLHIGANNVLLLDQPQSVTGIGRYFPRTVFKNQLLP